MYDVQVDLQQKKWSRREEGNFLRTILAYGVEYNKQDQRYNWDR
jgi:chromodomain-helicase-DNA-binding protein 7